MVVALVAAAVTIGATSAVAVAQSPSAAAEKVPFTYGTVNDIDSFNPLIAGEAPAYVSFSLQYNLLLDFAPDDLSPIPGIASEVPTEENGGISADGLTWTFKLRDGVKMHDGSAFTANDVKTAVDRVVSGPQAASFTHLANFKSFVTGATVVDPLTV